jgi:hypothetical protein
MDLIVPPCPSTSKGGVYHFLLILLLILTRVVEGEHSDRYIGETEFTKATWDVTATEEVSREG